MRTWADGERGLVVLPDGRRLVGRGLDGPGPAPYLALLLGRRPPAQPWAARWVRWPDFGLPLRRADADAALRQAWTAAERGRVVVMCAHGRGRTGAALAVLAAMSGVPPQEAVAWIRRGYRADAVDAPWQRVRVRSTARRLAP